VPEVPARCPAPSSTHERGHSVHRVLQTVSTSSGGFHIGNAVIFHKNSMEVCVYKFRSLVSWFPIRKIARFPQYFPGNMLWFCEGHLQEVCRRQSDHKMSRLGVLDEAGNLLKVLFFIVSLLSTRRQQVWPKTGVPFCSYKVRWWTNRHGKRPSG
jgi:hypothetical protein